MKKMLRSKKGFSLVELLIVLTIIAVISALAINVFGSVSEKSKIKADNAQMENLRKSVMSYVSETEDNDMAALADTTLQGLVNYLSLPIKGETVSAKTLNQTIDGKVFGPYMSLNKVKPEDTNYVLPNPTQAGGKKRWVVNYYKDTQNCVVTMVDSKAVAELSTFTINDSEVK